jgi:hypothetical protein
LFYGVFHGLLIKGVFKNKLYGFLRRIRFGRLNGIFLLW